MIEMTSPLSIWLGGVLNNKLILTFLAIILFLFVVYLARSWHAYKKMNSKVKNLRTALLAHYGVKNDQQLADEVTSLTPSIDELSDIFGKHGFVIPPKIRSGYE